MSDDSVPTETVCKSCEKQFDDPPNYCPNCGSDDFETRPLYDFERDVDFPVILEYEVYDDHGELWRSFMAQVFGKYEITEDQIRNVPKNLPRMKYQIFTVYYKVTKTDLKGPFMTKKEAKDA